MVKPDINKVIINFEECTKTPTNFLSAQEDLEDTLKTQLKTLYDCVKRSEDPSTKANFTLPKLIINEFDVEQIWQQIEIQNQFICGKLEERLSSYYLNDNQVPSSQSDVAESDDDGSASSDESENSAVEENEESGIEDDSDLSAHDDENVESDIEDGDFNSDDENLRESDQEAEDSDDSIDYFQDITSEDESNSEKNENSSVGLMYKDFFKNPDEIKEMNFDEDPLIAKKKKSVRFNLNDVESKPEKKSSNTDELKSTFEQRQERLQKKVEKLEKEALAEKPWQLKGEVTAKTRPPNSLLEQVLEFDLTSRPAPIITEEAALKLEDIIIRRIKDKVWDDVERKIKPVDTPVEFKKKLVLDQEKSKLSLAKIYEQEYLKQKEAADPRSESKEEEPKEHVQIRSLLDSLFRKLDSLSNYHYTPLPAAPELQIVSNLPAVSLEEHIPAAVSDATLLAPEEIKAKKKGDLMSKDERTDTDKKRSRRRKKLKQRLKQKEIQKREQYLEKASPGKRNKHSREKIKKELESLTKNFSVTSQEVNADQVTKSSKQFFERLQDTVSTGSKVKRKKENVKFDAKRIKL